MDVKIFVSDVDGTLSDGMYQVDENGKISKNFYTRDFDALRQLAEAGIDIFIITSSDDNVIIEKCKHLSFEVEVHVGIIDKEAEINNILFRYPGCTWENIAYIGDAENDIECMKAAGFSGCPSDAIDRLVGSRNIPRDVWRFLPTEEIREIIGNAANFVSNKPGGRGAVQDFAMEVLKIQDE